MDITGDKHRNPHWLREQYVDKGRTVPDIAEQVDVSRLTIRNWMERYGIETRGKGPTPDNTQYRDAEWLAFMYLEKEYTVKEIADRCDVSPGTISRWMGKHDIKGREKGAHTLDVNPMKVPGIVENHPTAGLSGEDHPSYIGEPDGWRKREPWISTRENVIQRDSEECYLCRMSREEHRDIVGQDFDVHHIHPTSDDGPKYDLGNLLTLCRSCHNEVHNMYNKDTEPTVESDWLTPETARYA